MRWSLVAGLAAVVCACHAAGPPGAPFAIVRRVFQDSFHGGLAQWVAELEKPGKVEAHGGLLTIDVPAGCTLWFREELSGPVMIEYRARMVSRRGANDRVSDLNAFWMATDARPGDFFGVKRSGKFSDYNQLRAYYVGQGGNGNTTTRFRRYIGDAEGRPILPENDRRGADTLRPNVWQTVALVAMEGRIQYYRDGKLIFDYKDDAPYTRGWYGFRTTQSHVELRDFTVHQIKKIR
jgi:hypothetical protein